jgi:hypothetical protein
VQSGIVSALPKNAFLLTGLKSGAQSSDPLPEAICTDLQEIAKGMMPVSIGIDTAPVFSHMR